jgi:hypothetical protein
LVWFEIIINFQHEMKICTLLKTYLYHQWSKHNMWCTDTTLDKFNKNLWKYNHKNIHNLLVFVIIGLFDLDHTLKSECVCAILIDLVISSYVYCVMCVALYMLGLFLFNR